MSAGESVREATARDLAALEALERASFPEPWSAADLAAWVELPERSAVYLLARGGSPLAYALFLLLPGEEAELLRLAVAPAERRRGRGTFLLAQAGGRLARRGKTVLWLEVRPENEAAIALYRRFGFVESGRRRAYYADGSDALVFRRESAPVAG